MTEKKNIRIIIQLIISKQYGNDRRKSDRNDNDRVQYRNRNPRCRRRCVADPIRDCPYVRGVRPGDYEQYTGDLQARRTAYVGNLESSDGTCRTVKSGNDLGVGLSGGHAPERGVPAVADPPPPFPDGRAEGLAGGTDGSELTSERKNLSNHLDSNVFAPVGIHPDRGDLQSREFVRQPFFSFRCYSNALSSVPLYESRSNFSISDSRYSTFPHIM